MTPYNTKPKITKQNIESGFVKRYFVKHVSKKNIVEVDETQYNLLVKNPYYQTLSFNWIIGGNDEDLPSFNGTTKKGAKSQNQFIIEYFDKKMKGLTRILTNPLEFFTGTQFRISASAQVLGEVVYTELPPNASSITLSTTELTFTYEIYGTSPSAQTVNITADGTLSQLFVTSGSTLVSVELASTTAPTTATITPNITGLYSGSYITTVQIGSSQSGIVTTTIPITINVTNNPDILFVYSAGMPLSTATFTRTTSASYNELVS